MKKFLTCGLILAAFLAARYWNDLNKYRHSNSGVQDVVVCEPPDRDDDDDDDDEQG